MQWARMSSSSPVGKSGVHNPGWPGCCRPPQPSEVDKIPPADWPAVHTVHRTPIPTEIKQLLDLVKNTYSEKGGSLRGTSSAERKALVRVNSSPNGSARTSAVSIPQKGRQSGSPQGKPSSLVGSGSRHSVQPGISPGNTSLDHSVPGRRVGPDTPLKRVEGFRTTPPASLRKLVDGEHPPASRPSLTAANPSLLSPLQIHGDQVQPILKRRGSTASSISTPLAVATNRASVVPKASVKNVDVAKVAKEKDRSENAGLEKGLKVLKLSGVSDSNSDNGSRSSGGSGGSVNDNSTVTSDGGFTDYLSDESEAELQRQAVERAAILEQNRMEEQEFRQARQQLASVDLRPPQVWTTGVTSSRKAINTGYTRGG
ncbi:hypothetical protein EW145_g153 [Phellinidium pouzarii]|uniref:Uncharacterized protein n=1 Tax=Phellinidium pouzarii TaxID=167371 RepID=A0A4S4LJT3_9AGAM|nr:hypothetical protein EW145_g153 [Phellinidium pouzarii]